MAGWKVHLMGGFAFCIVFIIYFFITKKVIIWSFVLPNLLLIITLIFLYSLLPDIDLENSKISKMLMWYLSIINILMGLLFSFGLVKFNAVFFLGLLIFVVVLGGRLPHRGITHTLIFAIVVSAPLFWIIGFVPALMAFISYWSHLWLDVRGNTPLYPIRLWGAWR